MKLRGTAFALLLSAAGTFSACSHSNSALQADEVLPPPGGAAAASAPPPAPDLDPWPRSIPTSTATLLVYSPQVESWQGNQLSFRMAVGVQPTLSGPESYGVIWGSARTEVNRETRMVTLQDLKLTRSNFPTLDDNGASYLAQLGQQLPVASKTIALDRIEASLAASGAAQAAGLPVKNSVPNIIVSYGPALLIPIDGTPVVRKVADGAFERVINTRALIARAKGGTTWYLHLYQGWLSAPSMTGPFALAATLPDGIDAMAQALAEKGLVDLLNGGNAQPQPSLANGVPAIYVTQQPSELIVFKGGQPELQPISGTSLLWCTNTTSDVLVYETDGSYYVLLSGRWFNAKSLNGPWTYVPSQNLPVDFVSIPPSSPAGVVLAAVAGTTQAREAVISNSVPQTGAVPLANPPTFAATYDGSPSLLPIAGTPLKYVANSPTPVIRVSSNQWYALRAGVWFTAPSATGPWTVATFVPDVIYTIPTSSPLHYVTYVQVYSATPEYVYTGYTPGYLGTVVAPDGVVVYGTGYDYDPWVGNVWYAPPETWGVAAEPIYNPAVGYGYGFGMGLATAAVVDSWNSPYYYGSAYHGYPCCGSTSASVYGHYGNVKYGGETSWYANSSGYGQQSSGTYHNEATGTTGSYNASRGYDAGSDSQYAKTNRTYDTAAGGSGDAQHKVSYDYDTGKYSYKGSESGTTASGNDYTHTTSGETGQGMSSSTSVTSGKTGQTYTTGTGDRGNNVYAGADGNAYKNSGSGWQSSGSNGWQNASGNNSWADNEQKARSQSQSSFGSFSNGARGDGGFGGSGGGGGGGWSNHFGGGGGGGFGDRFGEGGGGFHGGGFGGGGGFHGGRR